MYEPRLVKRGIVEYKFNRGIVGYKLKKVRWSGLSVDFFGPNLRLQLASANRRNQQRLKLCTIREVGCALRCSASDLFLILPWFLDIWCHKVSGALFEKNQQRAKLCTMGEVGCARGCSANDLS